MRDSTPSSGVVIGLLVIGLLVGVCASLTLLSACNGADACGCLCSPVPDGALIAPCSTGVVVVDDGASAQDIDAAPEE